MTKTYACESCGQEVTNKRVIKRLKGKDGRMRLYHIKYIGHNVATGEAEGEPCGPLKPVR